MKLTSWLQYFWKVPFCGLLFFLGFIPGDQMANWLGLSAPEMPIGADPSIVTQYTLVGSMILAMGLSALARGLSGSFLTRWLILFFFTWIAYGVNNYLEAAIFSTMAAASLYTVVMYLSASLLCSAAVAWLFPSNPQGPGFLEQVRTFFADRSTGSWSWRLLAAFLTFPVIYYSVGSLIAPIVLPYYLQGVSQLRLPAWSEILPVLALRSLLFLLVCLPVLISWKLSSNRLFLTLGLTLFLLVGGLSMMGAYWLPTVLRVTHSIEIFVDEMIYAGALLVLLGRHVVQPKTEHVLVPVR